MPISESDDSLLIKQSRNPVGHKRANTDFKLSNRKFSELKKELNLVSTELADLLYKRDIEKLPLSLKEKGRVAHLTAIKAKLLRTLGGINSGKPKASQAPIVLDFEELAEQGITLTPTIVR